MITIGPYRYAKHKTQPTVILYTSETIVLIQHPVAVHSYLILTLDAIFQLILHVSHE